MLPPAKSTDKPPQVVLEKTCNVPYETKHMTETEQSILDSLRELEENVRGMATANPKPNLLPLFDRIDQLTRQLPRGTDPDLLHYLHRKSYEKARFFLEGRESENKKGNCGQ